MLQQISAVHPVFLVSESYLYPYSRTSLIGIRSLFRASAYVGQHRQRRNTESVLLVGIKPTIPVFKW
jgi:hypothetical protein